MSNKKKNNKFKVNRKMLSMDIVRAETLDNVPHLVFPVVMMVEGVHTGSAGPAYYSANKLADTPDAWNTKPIVVYHPNENGDAISACSKEILENHAVGIILNASFEDGKLKAEAWINEAKADKVYPGLLSILRSGTVMEVSIGHFTEDKEESGSWNNEDYERVIEIIKPDHLALLPTEVGACSVEDGAGIPRVNKDFRTNQEVSHDEIRSVLYTALVDNGVGRDDVYIEAVYDDYFVYSIYGSDKRWKRSYTVSSESAELGLAEEVRQLIEYVTVNHDKETHFMDDKLKELLLNKGFSEESLETLSSLPDAELEALHALAEKPVVTNQQDPPNEPDDVPKDMTVNEYLQRVPEQFREVMTNGLSLLQARRQELIKKITANERNRFTSEALGNKSVEDLEAIAALAVEPDFTVNGSPTANQGTPVTEEALPEPTLGGTEE